MSKYTLIGIDGNAFSILGYVSASMKKEGKTEKEIKEYQKSAMAGDYSGLLAISSEMIDELNQK